MVDSQANHAEQARIDKRRKRMREAQRKHRAKQEQKVQDLDVSVLSLQTRLDHVETHFNELEAKLLDSTATVQNPQMAVQIQNAIADFRRLSNMKSSPYQDILLVADGSLVNDIRQSRVEDFEPLPDFALSLFDYSVRVGVSVLSGRDMASVRLARKVFKHQLVLMGRNEEGERMRLKECLTVWATMLDGGSVRGQKFARKTISKPRLPGFSGFFDVAGVEKYLRSKGVIFGEKTVQLPVKDIFNEVLDTETWPMFYEPMDQKGPSTTTLPFGLVDFGYGGMSVGVSDAGLQDFPLSETESGYVSQSNSVRELSSSPERDYYVEISQSDLIHKLAFVGLCMGGPGPGFLQSDIDLILKSLASNTPQPLMPSV